MNAFWKTCHLGSRKDNETFGCSYYDYKTKAVSASPSGLKCETR